MKKRILIVSPLIPKYNVEFFENLLDMSSYDLYIAANIENKNDLTLQDYNMYKFNAIHTNIKQIGPFQITLKLSKIISKVNPDIIIYSASPRDLGQMFSIIRSRILGYKVVVWSMFHRIGGPRLYSSIYYWFLGKIAHRNMTYSRIGKLYQIARSVKGSKVDVIGTAIDERKIFENKNTLINSEVESLLRKYNLDNKFVLLQVVRLTEIKKPFFLIDMMKLLVKEDKNVVLILIGGGILEDRVKKYVKSNGLTEFVIFLGPIYDEKVLNQWFTLSQVFVIPTCIGLSAHHACAYGLPIITDNSLINQASEFDILSDRLNCLLYEENSLHSFVEKILELKENEQLYKRLSSNALTTVSEVHSISKKVANFISSIEKI